MLGALIAALAVLARHDSDEAPSRVLAPRALGDRDANGAARDLERQGCETRRCIHGLTSKYYIDFPRAHPKERVDSWCRGLTPTLDDTALAAEHDVAHWATHVLRQYGTLRSSVCPGRELGLLTCTMGEYRQWLDEPARPIKEGAGLIFPASVRVGTGGRASDRVVKVTAQKITRVMHGPLFEGAPGGLTAQWALHWQFYKRVSVGKLFKKKCDLRCAPAPAAAGPQCSPPPLLSRRPAAPATPEWSTRL